jgi:hypothetical protein
MVEARKGLVDHHGGGAAVNRTENVCDGGTTHVVHATQGEINSVPAQSVTTFYVDANRKKYRLEW